MAIGIYKKTFGIDPFFKGIKNRRLISFFAQRFGTKHSVFGDYLYREGDEITSYKIC